MGHAGDEGVVHVEAGLRDRVHEGPKAPVDAWGHEHGSASDTPTTADRSPIRLPSNIENDNYTLDICIFMIAFVSPCNTASGVGVCCCWSTMEMGKLHLKSP